MEEVKTQETAIEPGPDTPADWRWLGRVLGRHAHVSKKLGISLTWQDPETPVLGVSDKVGHVEIRDRDSGRFMSLAIHPKVAGSVTGMLTAILSLERGQRIETAERATHADVNPSAWLSSVYLYELDRFLTHVRLRGEEREEELAGEVRGRFLVDEYVKRNYWTRRQRAPCRFVEWTVDNLPNRVLRYALALSRRQLTRFDSRARAEIGFARRSASVLQGVQEMRIRQDDFGRLRSLMRGPFRHYRDIVHLAKLVIFAFDPLAFRGAVVEELPLVDALETGETADGEVAWDVVDMPKLFEEYVRVITDGTRAGTVYRIPLQGEVPETFAGIAGKSLQLDRAPIRVGRSLVIDAKYKSIGTGSMLAPAVDVLGTYHVQEYQAVDLLTIEGCGGADDQTTRQVSSADVYQALAYATHRNVEASAAALVYPITEPSDVAGAPTYHGLGHRVELREEAGSIPIFLLGARIDRDGIREEMLGRGLRFRFDQVLRGL